MPEVYEPYGQTVLGELACDNPRGEAWAGLEPCGSPTYTPGLAPFGGLSTATNYAPTYYALTAVPYRVCEEVTSVHPRVCGRAANTLWLGAAAAGFFVLMVLLGCATAHVAPGLGRRVGLAGHPAPGHHRQPRRRRARHGGVAGRPGRVADHQVPRRRRWRQVVILGVAGARRRDGQGDRARRVRRRHADARLPAEPRSAARRPGQALGDGRRHVRRRGRAGRPEPAGPARPAGRGRRQHARGDQQGAAAAPSTTARSSGSPRPWRRSPGLVWAPLAGTYLFAISAVATGLAWALALQIRLPRTSTDDADSGSPGLRRRSRADRVPGTGGAAGLAPAQPVWSS